MWFSVLKSQKKFPCKSTKMSKRKIECASGNIAELFAKQKQVKQHKKPDANTNVSINFK